MTPIPHVIHDYYGIAYQVVKWVCQFFLHQIRLHDQMIIFYSGIFSLFLCVNDSSMFFSFSFFFSLSPSVQSVRTEIGHVIVDAHNNPYVCVSVCASLFVCLFVWFFLKNLRKMDILYLDVFTVLIHWKETFQFNPCPCFCIVTNTSIVEKIFRLDRYSHHHE